MKEIGGYFGLEEFSGKELYSDLIAVNSARNALAYLIKARKIEKLYIPYYLCDSVSGVCDREGCAYEYYNIGKDFKPIFDTQLESNEYLYVVNYFGQIDDCEIVSLKNKYERVIFDNVQAFFREPIPGIDTVYSCRKFFGVPDGGYVSTDALLDFSLQQDASMNRMKHVLGRFEGDSASAYYKDFRENDDSFSTMPLCKMSKLTQNIMRAVDYEEARSIRERNFALLDEKLGKYNGIGIKLTEGPYVYPFYCENGMEIKKKLAQNKIYVATLWPEVIEMGQALERCFAENILPLPCDQRYDSEDMMRVASLVLQLISLYGSEK